MFFSSRNKEYHKETTGNGKVAELGRTKQTATISQRGILAPATAAHLSKSHDIYPAPSTNFLRNPKVSSCYHSFPETHKCTCDKPSVEKDKPLIHVYKQWVLFIYTVSSKKSNY